MEIELNLVDVPEWCEATISNPIANIPVREAEPYQSTLTVAVTENAPAFQQATVRISATSKSQRGLLFNLAEETAEFDITFIIGYWCSLGYDLPDGSLKEVKSKETADFKIDIVKLGNGPTYVEIDLIEESEEGWSVNIPSTVVLDSEEGNTKKSVHLRIVPPTKSDKKEIRKTFGVKFVPSYLGRPDLEGQTETLYFNVQANYNLDKESESDNNLLIILGAVIFLIILISIFLKWRRKH